MTNAFQPRFIFGNELGGYGLPTKDEQSNIMSLVDTASSLIDEHCGRTDGDGNGSLVYTTYMERLLLPEGRNIVRTMFRPLAAVAETTRVLLQASGANYYTGFQASSVLRSGTTSLSPIVSASGRYGYGRRGSQQVYPDLNYGANVLQIASFFGGPPNFTPIDIADIDFDPRTAEVWIPAGLYLSAYTEIFLAYISGYDPANMPTTIKNACAMVVRNLLARAGGTTGLKSLSAGRVSGSFTENVIDETIDMMLRPYTTVIAY